MILKELFRKTGFVKDIFTLTSGTVIAQLIPILLQPILRRFYSPDDFGAFAVYISIVGILAVASAFRYEMAIVLPKKDKQAANILSLSIIINLLFNALILIIVLIFKHEITSLLNFPEKFSNWLYVIPLSTFLFSSYRSMNYWLIRQKAFRASSINKVSRRAVEGITQTGLGFFKYPAGLIYGDLFGNIANNISGIIQLSKTKFSLKLLSKRKISYVSKKYIEFPKYNLIPALLNTASLFLPIIIINKFYSQTVAGHLDLTKQVLAIPAALIALSISQVLLQRISDKKNKQLSVKKDVYSVLGFLTIVGILEIIVIGLWAPELFGFIFGDRWEISGVYSQILVLGFVIKFVVSPISIVFIALEKIKIGSIWQVFYFLLVCSLLLFSHLSIENFLKLYVAFDILAYTLYFVLIYWVVRDFESKLKKTKQKSYL